MLTPEQKRAWIDALRGGRYTQGRRALKTDLPSGEHAYCCLGVLYDITNGNWHHDEARGQWATRNTNGVAVSYHLYGDDLLCGFAMDAVIALNDTEGTSFHDIADWIERHSI